MEFKKEPPIGCAEAGAMSPEILVVPLENVRSLLTSATIKAKKEVLKELGYEAHEYNATSWIERKAKSLGINLEDK